VKRGDVRAVGSSTHGGVSREGAHSARGLLGFCLLFAFACAEPTVNVTVELSPSTKDSLNPFSNGLDLERIRVRIDGPDRFDEAWVDLAEGEFKAEFSSFPSERTVRVEVKAFDAAGILRAYGRKKEVRLESDTVAVQIPFRRLLAYVTHASICDGRCRPEHACVDAGRGFECLALSDQCMNCGAQEACVSASRQNLCLSNYAGENRGPNIIYALDVNTRKVVERISLPGASAQAASINAHEGDFMLVPFVEDAKASLGILSQSDHSWKRIEFDRPFDLAIMGHNGLGVAAGTGQIQFFELESGRALAGNIQLLAGTARQAVVGEGGRKAVILMSGRPGVLLVDFETQEIYPPGEIEGASGLGVSEDGRLAYITSSDSNTVKVLDLRSAGLTALSGEFSGVPGQTVFTAQTSSLLSIYSDAKENIHRVIAYSVSGRRGFDAGAELTVLPNPRGIAVTPGGGRVVLVSAGTSSQSAGLTVIDPDIEAGLQGSTISYPRDTEDSYPVAGGQSGHQRYRPSRIAISYGR